LKPNPTTLNAAFGAVSRRIASATGRPGAFVLALVCIAAWAASGPWFHYSDTWQLVINTGTTVITFLMVFLIQNTQNRDSEALQLKLDELIRAIKGANNAMIDLESLDQDQLDRIRDTYTVLAEKARAGQQAGKDDTRVIDAQLRS